MPCSGHVILISQRPFGWTPDFWHSRLGAGFAEGETSKPSPKYVGGKGTQGAATYMGPCTPAGAPHHYTFTLIATDLEPAELPPGLTRDELFAKLTGHTKGATGLIGLFGSP